MIVANYARRDRRWAIVRATLILAAMLYPLRQHLRGKSDQADGFPLSFYPMFRTLRRPTTRITYAVGIDDAGHRRYLPYKLLGDGGFNQVRHQMNREVKAGRATEHLQTLAERIASAPTHQHIIALEVVRGRFDLDTCLLERHVQAMDNELIARAEVPR